MKVTAKARKLEEAKEAAQGVEEWVELVDERTGKTCLQPPGPRQAHHHLPW